MSKFNKKKAQKDYALKAIEIYFYSIKNIETSVSIKNKEMYQKKYLGEILKLSSSFNITLSPQQKLLFCKKCHSYFCFLGENKNCIIRLNPTLQTKEYRCLKCNYVKRKKYK